MTKQERIKQLEEQIFLLECKDTWNPEDYITIELFRDELYFLRNEANRPVVNIW